MAPPLPGPKCPRTPDTDSTKSRLPRCGSQYDTCLVHERNERLFAHPRRCLVCRQPLPATRSGRAEVCQTGKAPKSPPRQALGGASRAGVCAAGAALYQMRRRPPDNHARHRMLVLPRLRQMRQLTRPHQPAPGSRNGRLAQGPEITYRPAPANSRTAPRFQHAG